MISTLHARSCQETIERFAACAALPGAYMYEGRRDDAFRHASEIEERGRSYLAQTADVLSEREALEWSGIRETGITVLTALAADSIGVDATRRRAALDAVIRSRVLVLDRRAEERFAASADDPKIAPLERELEASRDELARLLVGVANEEDVDSTALASARRRREEAERALGAASASYRVSYLSEGRRVEHQTDDPTELLHRLTRDALARGERLEGLEVTRPTLEEVYLELTHEADAV